MPRDGGRVTALSVSLKILLVVPIFYEKKSRALVPGDGGGEVSERQSSSSREDGNSHPAVFYNRLYLGRGKRL